MKRKLVAFSMTVALLLSVFSAASVGAHTVTIESTATPAQIPTRSEWFGQQPDQAGEAIIQRNAAQQGELIYNDAGRDSRLIPLTDLQFTQQVSREVDLDWFGVTADANNLNFIAKPDYYRGIQNNPSIELIITIDTNHTGGTTVIPLGTGNTFAQTNVPADAAWEYAINTSFRPGTTPNTPYVNGSTVLWTNGSTKSPCSSCNAQLASAAVGSGSFAEISVPWAQIGGKPTGANFLRFTVSIMYSPTNASDPNTRTLPADGFNSPIIDFLGAEKTPKDTLATLQSGTLKDASVFDVHFNTNGATPTYEPYAPLLVTEFQPNPVGTDSPNPDNKVSKDSEWIEIHNPNSFAIDLTSYKIGNAAKRGSGQGMFKFKSGSLAANGTIVVARFKSRFLLGHPNYTGTVLDLTTDLTPYTAWATGSTIDLDNGPASDGFEEQVMILDAKDVIVDMATYGNPGSPYPGHTPIALTAVAEGYSYERCPANFDTNNSNTDFVVHTSVADQTPGVACVGKPGIDMQIAKTGPVNVAPGEPIQYTLTYANLGDTADTPNTVTITDTLPAGVTYTNAVPAPANISGQTLTWVLPAPAPNAAESGTILVDVTSDASLGTNVPLVNTAGITSANEQVAAKTNNVASWTVTTLGPPDLSVSSTFAGPVKPGEQLTFTIGYQNIGQDDATNVKITDMLPAGVTLVNQHSNDANFVASPAGKLMWEVGTLTANQSGTIDVTVLVASTVEAGTSLQNTVTISGDGVDPTPANNTVTQSVVVDPIVIVIEKIKTYLPVTTR